MDRRERLNDPTETMRVLFEAMMTGVWTAMPGIIEAYNPNLQTAVIQPSISGMTQGTDGQWSVALLPMLVDVPVQFPGGGGCSLTFPVAPGDECLVVFASRNIDSWFQSGGVQFPPSQRTHSLSDGFALLGFRSMPRTLSDAHPTATQLRSDDGATSITLDPIAKTIALIAANGITIAGPTTVNGTPI